MSYFSVQNWKMLKLLRVYAKNFWFISPTEWLSVKIHNIIINGVKLCKKIYFFHKPHWDIKIFAVAKFGSVATGRKKKKIENGDPNQKAKEKFSDFFYMFKWKNIKQFDRHFMFLEILSLLKIFILELYYWSIFNRLRKHHMLVFICKVKAKQKYGKLI